MRRRFTIAIVGLVAGALLVTGLGTLLLLRAEGRRDTKADLLSLAGHIADQAAILERPIASTPTTAPPRTAVATPPTTAPRVLRPGNFAGLRAFLLKTQDMSIFPIGPRGRAGCCLPPGLSASELKTDQLLAGQSVSGVNHKVAFAIVPFVGLSDKITYATAVTQPVSKNTRATSYFFLSAGVALLVAAVVAALLARRIARPLTAVEVATRRIAKGDFATRVPAAPAAYRELASLGTSINSMAGDLERLRGQERQFLLSVSHDLRTPLTSIRGFAEALADGTTTDTHRAAEVIAAEARRLERLVRDLLDLAKLDANRFSLDVRPVDVWEVVGDTVEGFAPAAERLGVQVTVHDPVTLDPSPALTPDLARFATAGGFPPVVADADRLAQVVANLSENALKYAASRIDVGMWYRMSPEGVATAQITVDDDGPGIPAADLPHVFERLWTSSRGQARQVGSGLGLAIVAELTAAMGGTISAVSPVPGPTPHVAPRAGTRLVVTLPLGLALAPPAPA